MNIDFTGHGWEDFTYWLDNHIDTTLKLKAIKQNPFKDWENMKP